MTDLSTANLKRLLAEATPGPWEAEEGIYPEYITDSSGCRVLWNNSEKLFWSNEDEDVHLAAAAPELAQEVIRLREQIKGLILAMETKAANNEWQDPSTIAGFLKEIVLGDHDD